MEKEFVQRYMLTNGKYFPESKLHEISSNMEATNVSEYAVNLNFRNPTLLTVLYWFVPLFWWLDRFFVGDIFGGIVKAFLYPVIVFFAFAIGLENKLSETYNTALFCLIATWFIWVFIDGLTIYRRVKDFNYRKIQTKIGEGITTTKIGFFSSTLLITSILFLAWGLNLKNKNIEQVSLVEDTDKVLGVVVAENGVNMRKTPNTFSNKILTIPTGSTIQIIEQSELQETFGGITAHWLKVEYNGTTGWVWGGFISSTIHEWDENRIYNEKFSEYGPLPVYLPYHPNHPDYDEKIHSLENIYYGDKEQVSTKQNNPFKNSTENGNGNDGYGVGSNAGREDAIKNKRKIVSSPKFDDLDVFEKCRIEYHLIVDEKGDVKSVKLFNYKTFEDESSYTWKERRERKKVKEALLTTLEYRIAEITFEAANDYNRQRNYQYVIEFEAHPFKCSVNFRPLY